MKKLFFFLSIVIICAIMYIVLINTTGTLSINILKGSSYTSDITKELSIPLFTIIVLCSGLFSGAGVISLFLGIQQDKVKAYKRELEKTNVSSDANASKVDVLEAKIKTLEKEVTSLKTKNQELQIQLTLTQSSIETKQSFATSNNENLKILLYTFVLL